MKNVNLQLGRQTHNTVLQAIDALQQDIIPFGWTQYS
jgi:hypothetical protein